MCVRGEVLYWLHGGILRRLALLVSSTSWLLTGALLGTASNALYTYMFLMPLVDGMGARLDIRARRLLQLLRLGCVYNGLLLLTHRVVRSLGWLGRWPSLLVTRSVATFA